MYKIASCLVLLSMVGLTFISVVSAQATQRLTENRTANLTVIDRIDAFWPEARRSKNSLVIRGAEKLMRYDEAAKEPEIIAEFRDPLRIGVSWWLSGSGGVAIAFDPDSNQINVIDTEQGKILRAVDESSVKSTYLKGLMLRANDRPSAWEFLNYSGDALYLIVPNDEQVISRISWEAKKPIVTTYADQQYMPTILSHALLSSEGEDFLSVSGKEGRRKSVAILFDSRLQFKGSLELPAPDNKSSWTCHALRVYRSGAEGSWEALAFYSSQLRWVVARFAPDGNRIIYQGELPHQGNPIAQFTACCFSQDQTWMAVSATDRMTTLAITDLRNGSTITSRGLEKPIYRLVSDEQDSQFFSLSIDSVTVWRFDRERSSELQGYPRSRSR